MQTFFKIISRLTRHPQEEAWLLSYADSSTVVTAAITQGDFSGAQMGMERESLGM